ncbi:MAG: hypothetical protein JXJ22_01270 [Bacteroidales bacterium]|nr:hypothetical protein [Bacteroidales bacterium]
MTDQASQPKQQLPNATATLVLGILSLVFGCILAGLILGIVGLAISKRGKVLHEQEPDKYLGWGSLNAGRIMSIIGIVLGGLTLLYYIVVVAILGAAAFSFWDYFG